MNSEDEKYAALSQKYDLVSNLLTAEPVENEKLEEFRKLFKEDFMAFANKESSLAEGPTALDKLRIVESRLEKIVAFPHIFAKTSVAIGGGFSSGKSAFVNSFITQAAGIEIPVSIEPATAIPSFVVSDVDISIVGFSHNRGTVDIAPALYNRLTHDFISTFSSNLKDIMPSMTVKVPLRAGLFENICLIDTPGYDSAGGNTDSDEETAITFLRSQDALIWMISMDAGTIPQSDLDFLDAMELDGVPFYVVLNRADLRSPNDREEILDKVQETLKKEGIKYVGISAYSSNRQKEYQFKETSLCDFFGSQNKSNGHLKATLQGEIEAVFKMYKSAIHKDADEAEKLKSELNGLSLKVQELVGDAGDEHDEFDRTIKKLKKAQSSKSQQFKQQMEQMEQIRRKMLSAVEEVFWSLEIPNAEEIIEPAERQRQEQVFAEKVGRQPSSNSLIVDEDGKTDLHIAAALNLSTLAISLLKASSVPTIFLLRMKDKEGATPLHDAAWADASETVEVLLDHEADVNAKDANRYTPLHWAAEANAHQAAEVLLDHGADVNAKDANGQTPLHWAAWANAHQTAKVLLDYGAKPNARSATRQTPLHDAAEANAHQTAKVLLDYGAYVHARSKRRQTPLHVAIRANARQTAKVLRSHMARQNRKK